MLYNYLIAVIIAVIDQKLGSSTMHTFIVCWAFIGSTTYLNFKKRNKTKVPIVTDLVVGAIVTALGPFSIFI